MDRSRLIPYLPIEKHGIIGDRRTAALVAADGTVDWLCLPDYDGPPRFGALLDASGGGHFRLGPAALVSGEQVYLAGTPVLVTRWDLAEGAVELTDAMAGPQDVRKAGEGGSRLLVRRLRCLGGQAVCRLDLSPRT